MSQKSVIITETRDGPILYNEESGWFYLLIERKGNGPPSRGKKRINLFRATRQGVAIRVRNINKAVYVPNQAIVQALNMNN